MADLHWDIGSISIEVWEEWSQFFERCNWRTFRLVLVDIEDDKLFGAFETTITLVGIGLRLRWTHTRTKVADDLGRRLNEAIANLEPHNDR